MSDNLFDMLDGMAVHSEEDSRDSAIVHMPFPYPGGKSKSVNKIIPHLPYTGVYIEPFGGSAAVLLARKPCKVEVYNDRYGGVVDFYRCLRNKDLMNQLCDKLELYCHSREEFVHCKETWENTTDPIERAAKWYYIIKYSFASLGRNFGRTTSVKCRLSSIRDKLEYFPLIHERFKYVQIENQDWSTCISDYDAHDAVFYMDPPYVDANIGVYKHELTVTDHRNLINMIFSLKGFVAVSGFPNPLYDNQPWDDKITWDQFVSLKSVSYTDSNNKGHLKGQEERGHNTECLWIKEAR